MIHRRLSALALVASGALVVTTTTMLPSFAADADRAEASSPNLADATSPFTIIVHLEEGSGDPAARLADAKKRIGDAVAQASPGADHGGRAGLHARFRGRRDQGAGFRALGHQGNAGRGGGLC